MSTITCPKCNSQRTHVRKDRSIGWLQEAPLDWIHCDNCGKDLYGDAALAEIAKQKGIPHVPAPPPAPVTVRGTTMTGKVVLYFQKLPPGTQKHYLEIAAEMQIPVGTLNATLASASKKKLLLRVDHGVYRLP